MKPTFRSKPVAGPFGNSLEHAVVRIDNELDEQARFDTAEAADAHARLLNLGHDPGTDTTTLVDALPEQMRREPATATMEHQSAEQLQETLPVAIGDLSDHSPAPAPKVNEWQTGLLFGTPIEYMHTGLGATKLRIPGAFEEHGKALDDVAALERCVAARDGVIERLQEEAQPLRDALAQAEADVDAFKEQVYALEDVNNELRAQAKGDTERLDDQIIERDQMIEQLRAELTEARRAARKHTYMTTRTGQRIMSEAGVQTHQVELEDVAHSLGMQTRYRGHCSRFYSIAEHSVLVAKLLHEEGADQRTVLLGLVHDAHEAYVGDMPSPFKDDFPAFREYENRAERAVLEHFLGEGGVTPEMKARVKDADVRMLHFEAEHLFAGTAEWADLAISRTVPQDSIQVRGLDPEAAKAYFIRVFEALASGSDFTIAATLD